VRVRITRRCRDIVDGVELERFVVGLIYSVDSSLASYLIANQCGEAVLDEEARAEQQDELQFEINVRRWRAVAADVIRRRSRRRGFR
jgi:hypothetical protein